MTLKEFLLSQPDSCEFDISFLWEYRCETCHKYFTEKDLEYSNSQTVSEFRKDVESMDSDTHYWGYEWLYDTDVKYFIVEWKEGKFFITYLDETYENYAETCPDCSEEMTD